MFIKMFHFYSNRGETEYYCSYNRSIFSDLKDCGNIIIDGVTSRIGRLVINLFTKRKNEVDQNPVANLNVSAKKKEEADKTLTLVRDLYTGAVSFGITGGLAHVPQHSLKLYWFYQSLFRRYVEYKLNQRTSYRKKISESNLGKWCERVYTGFTANTSHYLLNRKISLLFLERIQKKITDPKKAAEFEFPLSFSQVTKNILFLTFDSIAENLLIDEKIDHKFKLKNVSWEDKMIYRLHLLNQKGKLPKGFPDLESVGLDKYNFYEKIDKSLTDYLQSLSSRLLTLLDPLFSPNKPSKPSDLFKSLTQLLSYIGYKLEVRDQLQTVSTFYMKDILIKPFLDPHNLFVLILNSSGIKSTELEVEGFGLGSSDALLKTGKKFIRLQSKGREQNAFDKAFKKSSLKRSQKNLMEMQQRKKCRKLLEKYFADLFYFLVKGRNIPFDHSLYQKFRLAMEQIPIIGQTITSLHLLGFSVFYCSTFLLQTEKNRNISTWLFQNLSGRKLSRSMSRALVHLLDHPMWIIVIMQAINECEKSLFKLQPITHKLKGSKVFERNSSLICKFLVTNFINNTDERLPVIERDNFIKKHLKEMVVPFLKNIINVFDYIPSKEKAIRLASNIFSSTLEEYLLYMEITQFFRRSFIKVDSNYKFWEMWLREHLIEWSDNQVILKGYTPSPNYKGHLQNRLKPWNSEAKKMWSQSRKERVRMIRKFLKENKAIKILDGSLRKNTSFNASVKKLENNVVILDEYSNIKNDDKQNNVIPFDFSKLQIIENYKK